MMPRSKKLLVPVLVLLIVGGALLWLSAGPRTPQEKLDAYARDYIALAMALDQIRPGEVDIYFGPAEFDTRAQASEQDLTALGQAVQQLSVSLQASSQDSALQEFSGRLESLSGRVAHLQRVIASLETPASLSYSEQAQQLFGIDLGNLDAIDVSAATETLDTMLTGSGGLAYRLAQYRNQFLIPADKREQVFQRALEECRARTAAHWSLPAGETLTLEWSRESMTPWHSYEGAGKSVLRINPLAIAYLSSAVDVACHEAYPGHHAQYLFLEQQWRNKGAPLEESLTLLRSPETSLREGAAMYSVDLVFPLEERIAFEQEVLAPLAGLGRSLDIARYNQVRVLLDDVALLTLPLLRDYNDGVTAKASATFRLERDALVPAPNQLLDFSMQYGAYAAAYTLARQRLAAYVLTQAAISGESPWEVLQRVLEENLLEALLAEDTVEDSSGD